MNKKKHGSSTLARFEEEMNEARDHFYLSVEISDEAPTLLKYSYSLSDFVLK